ncbi:hypothetical protein Golob_000272, partial [Gossypium lobatum]|nr:hypothetical protein [Gossypium lobatum]
SRSSSIHGNKLDPGSKITLGPCSHRPCPTSGPASSDGFQRWHIPQLLVLHIKKMLYCESRLRKVLPPRTTS